MNGEGVAPKAHLNSTTDNGGNGCVEISKQCHNPFKNKIGFYGMAHLLAIQNLLQIKQLNQTVCRLFRQNKAK